MRKSLIVVTIASLLMLNLAYAETVPTPPQQTVLAALTPPVAAPPQQDPIQAQMLGLTDRLNNFVNDYNALEEKAKLRLDLLENENAALKSQIRDLDKRISHLGELQTENSNKNLLLVVLGFAGLLVWLAWLTFRRREKPAVVQQPAPSYVLEKEEEFEDEYDYLGSEEGIAAKLDLARAYIDMGDTEQARTTLEDVLKSGDASQQAAARELLEQLAVDTVH